MASNRRPRFGYRGRFYVVTWTEGWIFGVHRGLCCAWRLNLGRIGVGMFRG